MHEGSWSFLYFEGVLVVIWRSSSDRRLRYITCTVLTLRPKMDSHHALSLSPDKYLHRSTSVVSLCPLTLSRCPCHCLRYKMIFCCCSVRKRGKLFALLADEDIRANDELPDLCSKYNFRGLSERWQRQQVDGGNKELYELSLLLTSSSRSVYSTEWLIRTTFPFNSVRARKENQSRNEETIPNM